MDACYHCKEGGELLCCDGCNCAFHPACVSLDAPPAVSPSRAAALRGPHWGAAPLLALPGQHACMSAASPRLVAPSVQPFFPSHCCPAPPFLPPRQGDWFCPLCQAQGICTKPQPLPLQPKQVRRGPAAMP